MYMTIMSCQDCPFKRVTADSITCKLTKEVLMGPGPNDIDLITTAAIHLNCPMLKSSLTLTIALSTAQQVNSKVEAFIGNRVQMLRDERGLVVSKYKSAAYLPPNVELGTNRPQSELDDIWYMIIFDGGNKMYMPAATVIGIISVDPKFNYHPEFEFYFGFGEDDSRDK